MRILVEQYAKSILAVGIGCLLLGILVAVPSFGGTKMRIWQPNLEIETGIAFDEMKSRDVPSVFLVDAYALKAGETLEVSAVLSAKTQEETGIPVSVKAIYSEDFQDALSTVNGSICIEEPGIYWVWAEVVEKEGDNTSVVAKLFVNER